MLLKLTREGDPIMSYVDGFLVAVSDAKKDTYVAHAREMWAVFKEYGALHTFECWGDDVPEGKLTDFHRAVKRENGETVVFSWIIWPDKATREAGWQAMMKDERMTGMEMPFDGKRMIYGGFTPIFEA
jgi:uncharacterized protein YbaA (DUF1428 family)